MTARPTKRPVALICLALIVAFHHASPFKTWSKTRLANNGHTNTERKSTATRYANLKTEGSVFAYGQRFCAWYAAAGLVPLVGADDVNATQPER